MLASVSPVPLRHLNVGEMVKEKGLHDGYDVEWQTYTVNEDKVGHGYNYKLLWTPFAQTKMEVLDELEPLVEEGGLILDWHVCDLYPERWIDLVVVLRCNHTLLWERLEKR
jgi:adenylate kinase